MDKIKNFSWKQGLCKLEWQNNNKKHQVTYKSPPRSVILLKDRSGFAIVLPNQDTNQSNALILNSNNTVRYWLHIPASIEKNDFIAFHEIYYVDQKLTVIAITRERDVAFVMNPTNGVYERYYETR